MGRAVLSCDKAPDCADLLLLTDWGVRVSKGQEKVEASYQSSDIPAANTTPFSREPKRNVAMLWNLPSLTFAALVHVCIGARIGILPMAASTSHRKIFHPIANALALLGHEVVIIHFTLNAKETADPGTRFEVGSECNLT